MTQRKTKKARNEDTGGLNLVVRLVGVLLLLTAIGLGAVYLHYRTYVKKPVLAEGDALTLVIPKNSPWPRVVEILDRNQLVGRPLYFQWWARQRGLPPEVKAGTFELDGPLSLEELGARLREGGKVEETAVTFPEGFTIFHMGDRLEELGVVSKAEFLRAARSRRALRRADIEADSFEGYLFPDTYRFQKGTSAKEIVARLHDRWTEVWAGIKEEHAEEKKSLEETYDFDRHDIVTLASLVERETSANGERDLVSRVFLNRIDRDMRLQTDPTCVYGEETYAEIPSPTHCKDPLNRYSTYVIDGLPPGPIANPGRASLEAALSPSEEPEAKKYLFFVARRDGSHSHYFSKTFAEHKRAIRRFLK